MALVSPGIQISVNDQSQYVNSNVGSVPLVLLATEQDKTYNSSAATGTSKANAGKLLSFTSQRDLVTAMGTPMFQLSSAGTPINADERNEYGLLAAYSALGLGNQLYAIRADIDLAQLTGTSTRPTGNVDDAALWLDTANTEWGIYMLNATTSEFEHVAPMIITNEADTVNAGTIGTTPDVIVPSNNVGKPGEYAIVASNTDTNPLNVIRLFYKAGSVSASGLANTWVLVGSPEWQNSNATVVGTVANPTLTLSAGSSQVTINSETVSFNTGTVAALATAINTASILGVTAAVVSGKLALFVSSSATSNGSVTDGKLVILDSDTINTPFDKCGITAATGSPGTTYNCPYLFYGTFAQQPSGGWFSNDATPRPTGSIWWKTTSTGSGLNLSVKSYNATKDIWEAQSVAGYQFYSDATYALDPIGGGLNVPHGTLAAFYSVGDTTYNNFTIARQIAQVPAKSDAFSGTTVNDVFVIRSTLPGTADVAVTTITLTGTTAESFVTDILAANIPYVEAILNSDNTVTLTHTTGGEIRMLNSVGTPLQDAGYVPTTGSKPYQRVGYVVNSLTGAVSISDWIRVTDVMDIQTATPYGLPADGTLWYYSNPADIDIMINDGGWKGYKNVSTDARGYDLSSTDSAGVIVSASRPTSQSTGAGLESGDLWLDSSDLNNYPSLYRYNGTAWIAINNTDHTSNNGIIFADARWGSSGDIDPVNGEFPSVSSLLSSNYIDLDAPDWRLYPRGTLLFNTRRSGYNVKRFVGDYFNHLSFPPASVSSNPANYPTSTPAYRDAWVSESGLDENGVLKAGSNAQRSVVVAALKSAVDSNLDVKEETYRFNLLVAPGYPELIPNLVSLNENRGSTGFVIGDTPMTLAPTSAALTAWSNNTNGDGLATASPYLGVYYPAGLTNDLSGNAVAVPASHAVLRTFLYNDNVSYQWFAPAGVHRGLINNLSDIGYVNQNTGAFIHNGINQGMRDMLYQLSINPITQLLGTGLVVWGQETRAGSSTSRNRVNVVRLENYLRTVFNSIANGFLFEPNDSITRKTIATQIESALHDVLSKRGIYDFLVICDTSNNTPSVVANNQLYVDVAVEPMKDVEFIYIPIALYNPGTIANLGARST